MRNVRFNGPEIHEVVADTEIVNGKYRQVVVSVPQDSGAVDAFGRSRVSTPVLLIDLKRVGSVPDLQSTQSVSGSGSVNYVASRASNGLVVGPGVGTAIRQTKARAIYQPGKSLQVFQSFILAPQRTGLTQRVGYFDNKNGVFFEVKGDSPGFVRRSFVTGAVQDHTIDRSEWNLDPIDGTGPSGVVLDILKPNIFCADFEWLGVGRVRVGFVVNGKPLYAHEFQRY